jgi:hypothetical protein
MQTAIDPARNVWVMNNSQDIDSCFGVPDESAFNPMRWPGHHHLGEAKGLEGEGPAEQGARHDHGKN